MLGCVVSYLPHEWRHFRNESKLGVVEQICNLSTEEAQAGGSLVLRPAYKKQQQREIGGCCGAYQ